MKPEPTSRPRPRTTLAGLAVLALFSCGGDPPPREGGDTAGGVEASLPTPSDTPTSDAGTPPHAGAGAPRAPDEGGPLAGAPSGEASPDAEAWTTGEVAVEATLGGGSGLPVVGALRAAAHPDYDRLTVELAPDDGDGGMPGYRLEYIDRPLHQCGSGAQIHPVGEGWLELRLEPAQAHTEAGAPTLSGREIPVAGEVARRIYLTCDFEGVVTLVLALDAPNPYRVFTLGDPRRIVVDVRR